MGTNRAPQVADLFLFCYERDFLKIIKQMLLKHLTQPSRHLDDLLYIGNPNLNKS